MTHIVAPPPYDRRSPLGARLRVALGLAPLLALTGACALLPPPAEEKALTDGVAPEPPPVDSSLRGESADGSAALDPDTSAAAIGDPVDAAARIEESEVEGTAGDEAADDAEIDIADLVGPEPVEQLLGAIEETGPETSEAEGEGSEAPAAADTEEQEGIPLPPPNPDALEPTDVARTVVPPVLAAGESAALAPSIDERTLSVSWVEGEGEEGEPVRDLSYLVGGLDTPGAVVFIHGWSGDAEQWRGALERLAPDHRVLAIDLPGHGDSRNVDREEWTIPGLASDVIAMIRAEGLTDVILVGHGMGGVIALETAARIPKRIDAIIGVESLQQLSGDPNPAGVADWIRKFQADFPKEIHEFVRETAGDAADTELLERIVRDAQDARRDVLLSLMEHFGEHDARDVTQNVQCPVVCINSDSLPTDVTGNRALLSSFDVTVMEGVGHWLMLEAPETFEDELESLVESFVAAPPEPTGPLVRRMAPALVVEDPAALAAFYRESLGFTAVRRVPADESVAPDQIVLARDGVSLVLRSASSMARDPPGVDVGTTNGPLFLQVTDLGRAIRGLGPDVRIALPSELLADGSRRICLRDPAGNLVVLREPAPERVSPGPEER